MLPFHEFLNQKRAEQNAAERIFIEYILSTRKAPTNEPNNAATQHAPTGSPDSQTSYDASSGVDAPAVGIRNGNGNPQCNGAGRGGTDACNDPDHGGRIGGASANSSPSSSPERSSPVWTSAHDSGEPCTAAANGTAGLLRNWDASGGA